MCRKKKRIVLAGVLTLLCLFLSPESQAKILTPREVARAHCETLSGAEFVAHYISNPMAHETTYTGEVVELRGVVTDFYVRDAIMGYTNIRAIRMEGVEKGLYSGVHMEFLVPSKRLKEFRHISVGDFCCLRGVYLGGIHQPHDLFEALVFRAPVPRELPPKEDPSLALERALKAYEGRDYEAMNHAALEARDKDVACGDAYHFLGVYADLHKDYVLALAYFSLASHLSPEDPLNLYNMGRVYITMGETMEADKILHKMEKKFPLSSWTQRLAQAVQKRLK